MIIHMFQCHSTKASHPRPLPQSAKHCSTYLCLFCCLAYWVIITIMPTSIYMCYGYICCGFVIYSFYYVEVCSFYSCFLESFFFLIINRCWILSKAFSASIEIIIWSSFSNFLMWCITLIDLWILKNPCIPGIKPTWSWCMYNVCLFNMLLDSVC